MTDITKAQEMLGRSEYIRSLGIILTELLPDKAAGKMPFDSKHANPGGTMHGGCLYSLADTIAGTLAFSQNSGNVVTVEGSLHFLDAAKDTEYVQCEAALKRSGKHLVVVDVEIKDDRGKLLDNGCFTYFRVETE